jgi:aspartate/methionine/tyrosine aminotransferase
MAMYHVMLEAANFGYRPGRPDWCNLGQGEPEVGRIEGAPSRLAWITLEPQDHAYGPIGGIEELREAVADYYNRLYRVDADTRYKKENVSISSGGRAMIARILNTLADVRIGHRVPDSPAYEGLLSHHQHRMKVVAVPTGPSDSFALPPSRFSEAVKANKLQAFLLSNPCNPTGQVIEGTDLKSFVTTARRSKCTLIMDEFYSHFVYGEDGMPGEGPESAARYVDQVEKDPVLIVDGMSKSFRYPGWRLGWTLGPSSIIEKLNRAAAAIDGGPSLPAQRLAIKALEPERAEQETNAVRKVFTRKRNLMLDGLRSVGIRCDPESNGTFYVWGDVGGLDKPFNDAEAFFQAALERKVMTVPGRFFDVNPGGANPPMKELKKWVRFSFGTPEEKMAVGLERLGEMIRGD